MTPDLLHALLLAALCVLVGLIAYGYGYQDGTADERRKSALDRIGALRVRPGRGINRGVSR